MRLALLCALLVPFLANAQDTPKRKSGLWEVTMRTAEIPKPLVLQQCVDEKSDDLARQQGRGNEKCSKTSVRRESARVVAEVECKVNGSTSRTRAVISGDLASKYDADITTSFSPPLHGKGEMKMNIQARWLGPCKAKK